MGVWLAGFFVAVLTGGIVTILGWGFAGFEEEGTEVLGPAALVYLGS